MNQLLNRYPDASQRESAASTEPIFEINLIELFWIVWRRKWLIVACVLLTVTLGVVYGLQTRPVYRSSAQLMVAKKQTGLVADRFEGLADYESQLSSGLLSTQMMLVTSPVVVERAIEEHQLDQLDTLKILQEQNPDLTLVETVIANLSAVKGGEAREQRDANVMTIQFDGYEERECQIVLNGIIESYQNYLGETSRDVGNDALALIQKAKDDLSTQLAEKETAYRKFLEQSPLIVQGSGDLRGASNVHTQRLQELQSARTIVQLELVRAKTHLQQLEESLRNNVDKEALVYSLQHGRGLQRTTMGSSEEVALSQSLATLQVEEASLMEAHGPDHPKVLALRTRINGIRRMLVGAVDLDALDANDYLTMYLDFVREQIKESEARDAEMAASQEAENVAAKALINDELTEMALRQDIERTNSLFEIIVSRLQEISFITDSGAYNTQLIAPATLGAQVKPKWMMVIGLALAAGLLAGVGTVYLVESSDQNFHSPEEIRDMTGLAVIGQIPIIGREHHQKVMVDSTIDSTIATFHRPRSVLAESYRAVRTSMLFAAQGRNHQLIQVTSAEPGDGKSTLSTNLAVSFAQSGKKVLLLDADVRKPKIHKLLGLKAPVGVTSVIEGRAEAEEATYPTDLPNLFCMPCGAIPLNPSEMLSSPQFEQLLQVLRDQYDVVIVDTPPVLVVTDPSAVAARVDAVVLTVRLGKNAKRTTTRAAESLRSVGTQVAGIVVNAVKPQSGQSYQYQYQYKSDNDSYYADEPTVGSSAD